LPHEEQNIIDLAGSDSYHRVLSPFCQVIGGLLVVVPQPEQKREPTGKGDPQLVQ